MQSASRLRLRHPHRVRAQRGRVLRTIVWTPWDSSLPGVLRAGRYLRNRFSERSGRP